MNPTTHLTRADFLTLETTFASDRTFIRKRDIVPLIFPTTFIDPYPDATLDQVVRIVDRNPSISIDGTLPGVHHFDEFDFEGTNFSNAHCESIALGKDTITRITASAPKTSPPQPAS